MIKILQILAINLPLVFDTSGFSITRKYPYLYEIAYAIHEGNVFRIDFL